MAVVRNEVLGREGELVVVDGFVQGVSNGPLALLIQGKPGIGTTTFWLCGVDTAAVTGHRVLSRDPSRPKR